MCILTKLYFSGVTLVSPALCALLIVQITLNILNIFKHLLIDLHSVCPNNYLSNHAWLEHMNKLRDRGYPGNSYPMPWQHSCMDLIAVYWVIQHHWCEAFQVLFSLWVWILACNYSRDGAGTEINNCQITNMNVLRIISVWACICLWKRKRITISAIEWWLKVVKDLQKKKTKSLHRQSFNKL